MNLTPYKSRCHSLPRGIGRNIDNFNCPCSVPMQWNYILYLYSVIGFVRKLFVNVLCRGRIEWKSISWLTECDLCIVCQWYTVRTSHHTMCIHLHWTLYITVLLNIIIESAGPGHNICNIIRGLFIDPEHSHHVLFDVWYHCMLLLFPCWILPFMFHLAHI